MASNIWSSKRYIPAFIRLLGASPGSGFSIILVILSPSSSTTPKDDGSSTSVNTSTDLAFSN